MMDAASAGTTDFSLFSASSLPSEAEGAAASLAEASPSSAWLTIHAIELTNLYGCLFMWAVSGLHYRMFRDTSALAITAYLGIPPFLCALVNLGCSTPNGSSNSCFYWATWPLAGLALLGVVSVVRNAVRATRNKPSYLRLVTSISRKSASMLAICSAITLLLSLTLTNATQRNLVAGDSLDQLIESESDGGLFRSIAKQTSSSMRINLTAEFLVEVTLAALFWSYLVVKKGDDYISSTFWWFQSREEPSLSSTDNSASTSSTSSSSSSTSSSSTYSSSSSSSSGVSPRKRSYDEGVEETGEGAVSHLGRRKSTTTTMSRTAEKEKESESNGKQTKGAPTDRAIAAAAADTHNATLQDISGALYLRSLLLHSVIGCGIVFYAFCTWPFGDSWPYFLSFLSPLFLVSVKPTLSLGVITAALLGEIILYFEVRRAELQELHKLYTQLKNDNESLRTTNVYSKEKFDAMAKKIVEKQTVLDHSFNEMKSRAGAMAGLISSLSDSELPQEQRGYVTKLEDTNTQLTTFIRDVSIFTKASDGLIELEAQPFEVESLLESLITQLNLSPSLLGEKDVDITYEIADDVPRYLIGGATQLKNILESILWNAVKFTHRGSILISVMRNQSGASKKKLDQADVDGMVSLSFAISDTGIGIPPPNLGKLFQPFSSSTLKKYGGSGLGLSIAERLASLFVDGRISVESEEGKGSTFTFAARFSLDNNHPPPEGVVVSLAGFPIYIIDDNVQNWRQGLEALRDGDYKLLFVDYMLNGGTGVDVYRHIMDDPNLRDLIIIMMCTPAQKKEIQLICPTLNTFLLKPLRKKELLNIVMNHSGSKRGGYALEVPTNSAHENKSEEEKIIGQPLGGIQLNVLVAEDNKMSARILDMLIKKAGHLCTIASDGKQAFDHYCDKNFDIIFMDCRMPLVDGWEATKLIREKEKKMADSEELSEEAAASNHIPIVALTADDSREACLQVGMDDYLNKPVDKAAFYEMLQKYALQKQQRTQSSALGLRRASRSDSATQLPLDADRNRQSVRIMLVEDNATNALIGARVLRRKNFQVDIAQNGRIALDMFRTNPNLYKLLLMDIHMPVMDGVTCTRHIREFENAEGIEQKVPIIALTADTTPRQRRICIEAGCNEYLSKPINYPLLVDTVKRFLQPVPDSSAPY